MCRRGQQQRAHGGPLPSRRARYDPAPHRSIMQRLFDMKLADGSEGLDVVALVEQQPALLLAAAPAGGGGGGDDETAEQRLQVS